MGETKPSKRLGVQTSQPANNQDKRKLTQIVDLVLTRLPTNTTSLSTSQKLSVARQPEIIINLPSKNIVRPPETPRRPQASQRRQPSS
jgi:hypothetical protein